MYSFLQTKKHMLYFSRSLIKFLIFAVNQTPKKHLIMETKQSLFSSALKSGLIIGVVSIVIFIVMYVADLKPVGIVLPLSMLAVGIAISVILLVILFKKYRTEAGGFVSFRDAFLYGFIALVTGTLLYTAFTMIFIHFVDPDYYKNIMEAQKTWMEGYLAGKMPEDKIAEQLDKLDEQTAKMGSISTMLKNLIWSVIVDGIIALIVGAIMKKKPDMFDNTAGGVI
jgi:hypothetical protein